MAMILLVTSATDRWESSIGGDHDHSVVNDKGSVSYAGHDDL